MTTTRLGVDYHPVLRPREKHSMGRIAMDEGGAPERTVQRVGLADQVSEYLARFSASDFLRMLSEEEVAELRQAIAEFGADEIGEPNDADRPAGSMPANAMDAAIKMTPELAGIRVGDDSRSLHQHGSRRPSSDDDFASATLAKAAEIVPEFARIKIGV